MFKKLYLWFIHLFFTTDEDQPKQEIKNYPPPVKKELLPDNLHPYSTRATARKPTQLEIQQHLMLTNNYSNGIEPLNSEFFLRGTMNGDAGIDAAALLSSVLADEISNNVNDYQSNVIDTPPDVLGDSTVQPEYKYLQLAVQDTVQQDEQPQQQDNSEPERYEAPAQDNNDYSTPDVPEATDYSNND